MRITDDDSRHELLGPDDDNFHQPDDHRWFHETCWFFWYVPEHRLGGWFYNWLRPNVGISGGGAWVWDSTAFSPFEVPYFACYSNLRLDRERDLRDYTFPSGVSVKAIEPLTYYELDYADRDLIAVDLRWRAVMPPWVSSTTGDPPRVTHFDQVGRVTGTMALNGRTCDVDCVAIRDRSWSLRSERWVHGRIGYCNAANDAVAFLANSAEDARGQAADRVYSGYFVKDGRRARIIDGSRRLDRDPDHGFLRRITVEADDAAGRRFTAVGEGVSRMAIPIPGVHGVVWTSLVDWVVDGSQAWGEDQDAWPVQGWSNFRRPRLHGMRSSALTVDSPTG